MYTVYTFKKKERKNWKLLEPKKKGEEQGRGGLTLGLQEISSWRIDSGTKSVHGSGLRKRRSGIARSRRRRRRRRERRRRRRSKGKIAENEESNPWGEGEASLVEHMLQHPSHQQCVLLQQLRHYGHQYHTSISWCLVYRIAKQL